MPRDNNGTYDLPAGNPVVPGTVIASDWANPTMGDLGNEMSDSLSRMGKGGMQAPLRLINGAVDGPSLTFNQDILAGRYLFSPGDMRDTLQNQDRLRFTVDGVFVMIDGVWVPINPTLTGRKNYLMNGDFDLWQRGISFVDAGPSAFYTADRWFADPRSLVDCTVTRQDISLGQTQIPDKPQYHLRYELNVAATFGGVQQRIENVRTLANQTATLTFYARTTGASVTLRPRLSQNFSGGSASVTVEGNDTLLTTDWQLITQVFDVPDIDGKVIGAPDNSFLSVIFAVLDDATYGIDIAHAQFEAGPAATKFEHTSIAETLALCQRYYERWDRDVDGDIFLPFALKNVSITATRSYMEWRTEKRVPPTITVTNPLVITLENTAGQAIPVTAVGFDVPVSTKSTRLTITANGLEPGEVNWAVLSPTAKIEIDAEL